MVVVVVVVVESIGAAAGAAAGVVSTAGDMSSVVSFFFWQAPKASDTATSNSNERFIPHLFNLGSLRGAPQCASPFSKTGGAPRRS